jgi:MFS family permease
MSDDSYKESKALGHTTVIEVESDADTSSIVSTPHIFQDPEVAEHYRSIYEKSKYEGRHLFDPELTWTEKEEKDLVKKTEFRVTFWAFIMLMALDFDRSNMSQANADNILTDLGLTTNDMNLGNTINLICFLSAELPSQLISKRLGPDIWIPIQMILWSCVGISQTFLQNKSGYLTCRALMGLIEGGFIPDCCLWMSYFYKTNELPLRLNLFYIANPLTSALSSLMAYGIFRLNGRNNWQGWRWLFLIEGLFTLLIGISSFFRMPPSPYQTKTWFRKKPW